MEITLIKELIEAIGKVAAGVKTIVNLPKAEREKVRQTLEQTYRLIDTTLNMLIIRLGDIQLHSTDSDFLGDVTRLDNFNEWMKAEREFRLCHSLRVSLREMETLAGRLAGAVSINDWDALLRHMRAILGTEGQLADVICQQFRQLATDARNAGQDSQRIQSVRDGVDTLRASLVKERQVLIRQELELYDVV